MFSYPRPPSWPVPSGTFSHYSYVNQTNIALDNENVEQILSARELPRDKLVHIQSLRDSVCIIVRTFHIGADVKTEAIGTGTLINNNQIITAAHCLERIPDTMIYAVFGYHACHSETHLFDITDIQCHPILDVGLATLAGNPDRRYTPMPIRYSAQLAGEYWALHHAGGLALQISTGQIADLGGRYYQEQQEIIIHAGDGASGAGLFSTRSIEIVGIIYYRSMGFGRVSRKTISFDRIRDWLTANLRPKPLPIALAFNPRSTLCIGRCLSIRIDTSKLEEESAEAITWHKFSTLYIPQIREFLRQLDLHVNHTGVEPVIPAILSHGVTFDTHQRYHHFITRDPSKTIFSKLIGTHCKTKLINALGALVQFMQYLIFKRLNQRQRNTLLHNQPKSLNPDVRNPGFTFGFLLTFNVAEVDDDIPRTVLYMESGIESGPFHFYPETDYISYEVDRKTKNKLDNAHIYDMNKFLDRAIEAGRRGLLI